jgi:hypothetical protein
MLALTDNQLHTITAIAGGLPVEKRGTFLERLSATLPGLTGGRRPGDDDVERAARAALRGLLRAPAA